MAYALSSPTGFHWNQNDYAFVLLLSLPFTYLISNQWFRNLFRFLLLFLLLETGSRIGIYIGFTCSIFLIFQDLRNKNFAILLPFLFLTFVLTDGFYIFPTFNKKIKEVAIVSKSVFYQKFPEHCYQKYKSSEARTQLTKIALTEIKTHPLIGKGAGSFTVSLEEKTKNSSDYKTQNLVTNPHNFVFEVLVDFGLIILIPIILIVVQFIKRFKFLSKKERFTFTLFFIMILPMSVLTSSL
ncbi:MAG: O-antigen ligase family protein, partial [Flavobacteriia bacterium]